MNQVDSGVRVGVGDSDQSATAYALSQMLTDSSPCT